MRVREVRFLVQTGYDYLNNRAFLIYGWLVNLYFIYYTIFVLDYKTMFYNNIGDVIILSKYSIV